jgi:hypothetical protein
MSAPVQDDEDKRYMYAPPWARQTPDNSPDDVAASVGRLRRERAQLTTAADRERDRDPLRERTDRSLRVRGAEVDDRIQESGQGRVESRLEGRIRGAGRDDVRDRRDLNTSLFRDRAPLRSHLPTDDGDVEADADVAREAWSPSQLEPVPIPPPPKPNLGDAPWGMIARMGGAVVVAAIIALVISGALPRHSFDFWSSRQDVKPETKDVAQAFKSDVPAAGAVSSGVLSALAPVDVAVAAPAPASSPAAVEVASVKTEEPLKRSETRTIGRDEIDGLLKRGQALLKDGDIAAARLVLRRAAEAGDANAMLMLAGSYDRAELIKLRVLGVVPDHAQAKAWYEKAVELGSAEAVRRLQQLTQRAD